MSISSEAIKQDLDRLTSEQLQQVADFVAFLKFRDRYHRKENSDPEKALLDKLASTDAVVWSPQVDNESYRALSDLLATKKKVDDT
jgi:hypothetical protein